MELPNVAPFITKQIYLTMEKLKFSSSKYLTFKQNNFPCATNYTNAMNAFKDQAETTVCDCFLQTKALFINYAEKCAFQANNTACSLVSSSLFSSVQRGEDK